MGLLLQHHPLLATTDPGLMEAALRKSFGATSFAVKSEPATYRAAVNHWSFDSEIALSYCECDAEVDIEFRQADMLRVVVGLAGRAEYEAGPTHTRMNPDAVSLVGPSHDLRTRYHAGCRQLVLRVEQTRLRRHLEVLLGRHVSGTLTFDGEGAARTGGTIQHLMRLAAARLDDCDPPPSTLLMQELVHAMLAALLTEAPHSHGALLTTTEKRIGRSQVDHAEAFMEAHWDKALSVEKIAQELDCSVRSLFKGFQTQRGYSPMVFLRRTRLERARSLLLNPRKDTSVLSVALLCGFSNAGHFARYYRELYGVLPSETLRQGRAETRGKTLLDSSL